MAKRYKEYIATPSAALTIADTASHDVTNYASAQVVDSDLVASNIKKDVSILGVTGTYKGGELENGVIFFDYDGSIVASWDATEVANKSALPSNPSHTGLTAQGWNWTLSDIKSYIASYPDAVVCVGQMYATTSGLTEIDITVNAVIGKTVNCLMVGNKNWGDGTTDSATSHTYANYGDYTITCDGASIPAGTSTTGGMFGNSSNNATPYLCNAIRIGSSVTSIGDYAFLNCRSINEITLHSALTTFGDWAFRSCRSLKTITIPNGTTVVKEYFFTYGYSLSYISMPNSVISLGRGAFEGLTLLKNLTIPSSVRTIGYGTVKSLNSLKKLIIPSSVTSVENQCPASLNVLKTLKLYCNITAIGDYSFSVLTFVRSIKIPNSVRTIGNDVFGSNFNTMDYDFTSFGSVPTLGTSCFQYINGQCKIRVPASLESQWKSATNWASFANYIYGE